MKTEKFNASKEKDVLIAMIMNTNVLAKIHSQVKGDTSIFSNPWSNIVARWCLGFYGKHQSAPKRSIQYIFADWAKESKDEDVVGIVDKFLSTLSDDFAAKAKDFKNTSYWIDRASKCIGEIQLKKSLEAQQDALDRGDLEEAVKIRDEFQKIDFSSKAMGNFSEPDEVSETFEYYEKDRSLIQFPGALGEFLSPYFQRNEFIAFVAPDKRGKSYWLAEVVFQALKQKHRVLYYVFGDMSQNQVRRRFYQRLLRRPVKDEEVKIPVELKIKGKDFEVEAPPKMRKGISKKDTIEAFEKFKLITASKEVRIRYEVEGGKVLSGTDIENKVREYGEQGWPVDVLVIDYLDELAAEPHSKNMDKRDQITENLSVLRRIALRYHCLVVTASQTASTAYSDKWVIRKGDFSENKLKNAKVSGMIGINQTDDEKRVGVSRLNWVVLRDGPWTETQVVWCAGNLAIACPCIISSF